MSFRPSRIVSARKWGKLRLLSCPTVCGNSEDFACPKRDKPWNSEEAFLPDGGLKEKIWNPGHFVLYTLLHYFLTLTTDWMTGVRSQAEADFFSSLCAQTSSEVHPASYPMITGGKARRERDADH
jgi:hypothetical protein